MATGPLSWYLWQKQPATIIMDDMHHALGNPWYYQRVLALPWYYQRVLAATLVLSSLSLSSISFTCLSSMVVGREIVNGTAQRGRLHICHQYQVSLCICPQGESLLFQLPWSLVAHSTHSSGMSIKGVGEILPMKCLAESMPLGGQSCLGHSKVICHDLLSSACIKIGNNYY